MYKLAVSYDNGLINDHLSDASCFRVYDIEDGQIVGVQNVHSEENNADLVSLLNEHEVKLLICGTIKEEEENLLKENGIFTFSDASGSCDQAAAALLQNQLKYGTGISSNHPFDRENNL